MNTNTERLLRDADDPEGYEYPAGVEIDYPRHLQTVKVIRNGLDVEFGARFELFEAQDASFTCESTWCIARPATAEFGIWRVVRLGVRFSNFSRLFSIYTSEHDNVSPEDEQRVRRIVEREGFVYIPCRELQGLYDGANPTLRDGKVTWWIRFFDYL